MVLPAYYSDVTGERCKLEKKSGDANGDVELHRGTIIMILGLS